MQFSYWLKHGQKDHPDCFYCTKRPASGKECAECPVVATAKNVDRDLRLALIQFGGVATGDVASVRAQVERQMEEVSRCVRDDRVPGWVAPGFARLCGVYLRARSEAERALLKEK